MNPNKINLSQQAITKIKKLHQDHIQNHYKKIISFWRKAIIIDIIFSLLIIISAVGAITTTIIIYLKKDYEMLYIWILLGNVIALIVFILLYTIIKIGAIGINVFLNRLDYNTYYQIAIEDYFKSQIAIEPITTVFQVIPEPNFTSFSKNPKKNNLLKESLIRVSTLKEKMDNKVINGQTANKNFSFGVITVRKTMVILKFLLIALAIGFIVISKVGKGSNSRTNNNLNINNGVNLLALTLWIEMKRSENYLFFSATLPKDLTIEANIVPHQNKFKKFILNNKEINLEGTEFPNLFDTNSTDDVELRKILTPKTMANLIDTSKKYEEVLSMSFVNNKFTLLLAKYHYSKKAHYLNQVWKPQINHKDNIQNCIDDLITKIEIDLFHLQKGLEYLDGFDIN